ncbi:hypothetical protein CHS0354_026456 [Potamilus streckersoni]|uniref:RNB domain-containing protein n=1 Tax=Potamilus streckersoni TaxID=2493646 RepID=A0AAE0VHX2_9BIVA|nr:hypothetical protein CHS0354_026456 [Potamilus streckersoni]
MDCTCGNNDTLYRNQGEVFKLEERPEVLKFQVSGCGESVENINSETTERIEKDDIMNMKINTETYEENEEGHADIVANEILTKVSESFKNCKQLMTQESSNSEEAFGISPTLDLLDSVSSCNPTSTLSFSGVTNRDYNMRGKQTERVLGIQQSGARIDDVSEKNDMKQSKIKEECIMIEGVTFTNHQSHSSCQEKHSCNDRDAKEVHTENQDFNVNAADVFGDSSDSELEWEPIFSKKRLKYKKYVDFDREETDSDDDDSLIESDEDISLFKKSQRFHDEETNSTRIDKSFDYQIILNEGLNLSSGYINRFNDKNPRVLDRKPFYSNDCSEKEMYSKLNADPKKYMICSIYVEKPHISYCLPVKSDKIAEKIKIYGRSKAGQCFTEDEVLVQILNVDKAKHGHEKKYGKVIKRVKQHRYRDVKHPVFACVLDDRAGNLMIPLCKTIPKIHILDLYAKTKYPKHRKNYVDIYKYNTFDRALYFSDTQFISDDFREKFVFIVVFLTWSRRHIYPLGAVINILSTGSRSVNASLRVLDAMYRVPSLYGKQTVEQVNLILSNYTHNQQTSVDDRRDNLTSLRTFTIDADGAAALDDALSIETQEEGHRVGVHITDVTIFITKNDAADQEAKERVETFYSNIRKPRRLLPEPLSENVCSLLPNKERNCLSVFFVLDNDGEIIGLPIINSTIIQSHTKLSYLQVQNCLEGEMTDVDQIVATDVRQLFTLATKLRKRRLGNAMYASQLKDFDEFEARYLVEEFMVLANKCVTEKLLEVYPNQVPLLCLDPPSESNIKRWWSEHQSVVHVLLSLQDRSLMKDTVPSLESCLAGQDGQDINVSDEFLRIISRQDEIDLRLACKMLKVDELHPLQSTALHEWYSMQNKIIYKCSSQKRNESVDGECYHINGCPYTNFTSPLRRYFDMVVHRLVHCMIQKEKCCYTQEEIEDLCSYLNERADSARLYEEKCRSLIVAENLGPYSKLCTCIVVNVSDEGISLVAPAIYEIQRLFLSFKLLVMISKPKVTQNNEIKRMVRTKWKKRLYAFKSSEHSMHATDYKTVINIDPYKDIGFIPVKDWATLLIKVIHNQQDEEMAKAFKDMSKVVSRKNVAGPGNIVKDVSTEDFYDKDKETIAPCTEFSIDFSCGQTVNIQLSSVFQRGILTLCPQLFEMTKNIQFCLQHTDDPIKWLYRYSTLRTISTYRDENDYQKRWIPLVKMEAAICAVNNEESYVINNVPVLFDGKCGQFSLPVRYCQIRNILLNNMDHETNDDDEQSGEQKNQIVNLANDWLCVRTKMFFSTDNINVNDHQNYSYWIAHGKITSAEIRSRERRTERHATRRTYEILQKGKEKTRVTVDFQLHRTAPSIPSNAGEMYSTKCNIEMLIKSTVDRRTESYLKVLDGASILVKAIALGRKIPRLDQKHIRASGQSDRKVPFKSLQANNESQRDAINRSLVSAFSLIQGPPGSGKSYIAIKLLYLFSTINSEVKKREQVLFCGPSNKSVDNVARWTKKLLGDKCPKIARLYGRSIEGLEYPIPGSDFTSKRSMRYLKADENLRDVSVHHLIRQTGKPFAEKIREFDRKFRNEKYIPHFEEVSKYMALISKAAVEELQRHEVIMCTTGANIYQLIIDEAGMCTEPHCMAPIIANNVKQVILIGDHKQLRPIIKCKSAATLGMSKSLFERYAEDMKDTNYINNVQYTFLNMQYRMHPQLCKFPSKTFYNDKLETAQQVFSREHEKPSLALWPFPRTPHVLCHVDGSEEILTVSTEEGNEKSRSNAKEVIQVVKIFKYMVEEEKVDVKDINVISQYNAQCHALRKALEKERYNDCNVNTVVASQGGEWKYVIFSTVRSLPRYKIEPSPTLGWCTLNLGFITDHHQINVALTRAKRGLIIVGNTKLLMCDEVWKSLVKQYEASRCVVTSWEFPPRSPATADIAPA